MIAVTILPALEVALVSELLLIIVCLLAIQNKSIRIPAILILASSAIDLLSYYLLNPEVKELLAAVSIQDTEAFIAAVRVASDSIGELLNILGVTGLIIAARHKLHSAPQSTLVGFESVSQ